MNNSYLNGLRSNFRKDWYKLPNILTQIRLLGSAIPGILLLIWPNDYDHRIIVLTVFLLLAITDILDGLAARLLNQNTEYGRLLDPITDALFGTLTLTALAYMDDLAILLLIMLIGRQIAVLYIARIIKKRGRLMSVTVMGKFKAAMQVIATAVLIAPEGMFSMSVRIVITTLAAIMILLSLGSYVEQIN